MLSERNCNLVLTQDVFRIVFLKTETGLSYLIILRNIRGDASMIVLNQVLKDLSHQNWVIQNIALFTLVTISQVSEEIVDYDTVERSILATIKHGNLRAGSSGKIQRRFSSYSKTFFSACKSAIRKMDQQSGAINYPIRRFAGSNQLY